LEPTTVLKRSDKVTFQKIAEEAVLIHMDTGTYFSLNNIGTEFWELFDGAQSLSQLAEVVAEKYSVELEMVLADLIELVEELAKDDLVLPA
jgi:hypothetical protein